MWVWGPRQRAWHQVPIAAVSETHARILQFSPMPPWHADPSYFWNARQRRRRAP